jgi:protein TonB
MTGGPDATATTFTAPGPAPGGWVAAAAGGGKAPLAAFAVSLFLHGFVAAGAIFGFGGLGETPPTAQKPIIVELVFLSPSPGQNKNGANSAVDKSAAKRDAPGPIEPVEAVQAASAPSSKTVERASPANKSRQKAAAKPHPAQAAELAPKIEADLQTKTTETKKTTGSSAPADTQPSPKAPAVNVVSATVLKNAAAAAEGISGSKDGGFIAPVFQLGSAENPLPRYPWRARRQGIEGRVVIRLMVAADGTPERISVLRSSGYAILDRAAVRTFRDWRFRPATRAGIAVASSLDVPISFRLHD